MATFNWPGFGISAITPTLDQPAQINRSAYTGVRAVASNPWHGKWSFKVSLATKQGDANFQAIRAFFTGLEGSINNFHLPAIEAPQNANTGVTLSAAASQGATTLALTGVTTTLVAGNMVTIAGQLLSLTSVGTLTGSAQTINFMPALRAAASIGASVETAKPYALVALSDSSFSWDIAQWRQYGLSFTADEDVGGTDGASPSGDTWNATFSGSGGSSGPLVLGVAVEQSGGAASQVTTLNFASGLSVTVTGSTAEVDVTGSGGTTLVAGISTGATASANATAIQAAINALFAAGGGTLIFPPGVYSHSGITFKNKIQYRGAGRDTGAANGTVLLYTGTGDGVVVSNPINSSTAANIAVDGITFKNANRNAGKAAFADTGSTDIKFHRCGFIGSDRGLILDQSELADVIECDFEGVASQTSLIWIVDGADRNVSASAGFSNRISVQRCQLNGQSGTILIVDDGGGVHAFRDNNYNGGANQIRAAGVSGLTISGGEFESASAANILLHSITLAAVSVGSCSPVLFDNPIIVPTAGQSCVSCSSGGQLTFIAPFFGNTTAQKVVGTGNVSGIYTLGVMNGGGGASFDGRATNHFQADSYVAAFDSNLPFTHSGVQVVAARQTGWTAATGTATRTSFATGTVTLPALAQAVKALIDDLIAHGLIGA